MDNRELEKNILNDEELETAEGGVTIHKKYNNSGIPENKKRYICPQHPEGGEHEYETVGQTSVFWKFSYGEEECKYCHQKRSTGKFGSIVLW